MEKGYTLITGASDGIGKAIAENFFSHSKKVILVARRKQKLKQIAENLKGKYDEIHIFSADLTKNEDIEKLTEFIHQKIKGKVQHLINNAGFGLIGQFHKLNIKMQLDMVQLNISALMTLSHVFADDLIYYAEKKQPAGVLNISSIAGYIPAPDFAVYFATKAFVSSFSASLREEMKVFNVKVCSYCPGPVGSNFLTVAGLDSNLVERNNKSIPTPDQTAKDIIDAYIKNRPVRIQGITNRLMILSTRLVPSNLIAKMVRIVNKRRNR